MGRRRSIRRIFPAARAEVEVQPELGMARSIAASHAASPVGRASSTLSTPPSENSCDGPVAAYWAVVFFWCGVKLAQVRLIFVMFLIQVLNLVNH
jgi:hypothetical protein